MSLWQNNSLRFFARACDLDNHRLLVHSMEPGMSSVLWVEQALNTIRKLLVSLIAFVPLFPSGAYLSGPVVIVTQCYSWVRPSCVEPCST